jgi:hypothetical protein
MGVDGDIKEVSRFGRADVRARLTARARILFDGTYAVMVMKVPGIEDRTTRGRLSRVVPWGCAGLVLLGALTGTACALSKNKPDQRPVVIPLEPLGFTLISPHFVSPLATNFTIHFVDENHLLLTYTARTLLARLPDREADDDDRNVAALLLDLPSGKVLARTEWRTRDRDKFLWPLGHGRFLLRVRSRLSVIDPVGNLAAGGPEKAFFQTPFLELKRPIAYVAISPEKDLLGVETLAPRPKVRAVDADAAALAAAMAGTSDAGSPANVQIVGEPRKPPVQIYFFRLKMENADGTGRMLAESAGLVGSPNLINLPATGDGYLDMKRETGQTWDLDFVSHAGKRMELAAYDTTCAPRPYFISRSEFVAFGCRGSEDRPELSYFNMKGEEPWLSALTGPQVSPIIVPAPAAGRFAVSRTLVNSAAFDLESLTTDDLTAQEITVMQNYDGRPLLKVQASPIQRAGQNFDLSPEGLHFAVVRNGNIEVYPLPALTNADKKALDEARKMEPQPNDAPVKLNSVAVVVASADADGGEAAAAAKPAAAAAARPVPSGATALPAAESSQSAAESSGRTAVGQVTNSEGQLGDTEGASRKKPSLYSSEYPKGDSDGASNQKPQ